MGRLKSAPYVVGRLGSGMRVSANFLDNFPSRGSVRVSVRVRTLRRGRLGLGMPVSASFQLR